MYPVPPPQMQMPGMHQPMQAAPQWTSVSYGWIPGPHHVRGGFDIAREPLYVSPFVTLSYIKY